MSEWSEPHAPIKAAHERFLQSLPNKAQELQEVLPGLLGAPADSQVMEEMRRRLHALYASAQVFQSEQLADTVKVGIDQLDLARDQNRRIAQADIDVLRTMVTALGSLANQEEPETEPPLAEALGRIGRAPATVVGVPREASNAGARSALEASPGRLRLSPRKHQAPADAILQATPPKRASGSFTAVHAPRRSDDEQAGQLPRAAYTVLSVLVVGASEGHDRVRAALPGEGFEVLGTENAEEALRLARSIAPDVLIVAEAVLADRGQELISRLRSDPMTDFVPVIALVEHNDGGRINELRNLGVDVVLPRQVQSEALVKAVREVTDTATEGGARLDVIGKASALEVFRRMTQEMERGLIDALERGQDVRVDLGDGSDILAATWGAISRVRAQLSKASGGQIRFRDVPRRGGPAMMALVDDHVAEPEEGEAESSLSGRRILIVDDDPSVRWFFAGLLREQGSVVDEAGHGLEALQVAREHRPDVVISDILMPEMDGFALCRELKRDPGLADVPVILLSWKDDFLQRMRELNSGASGYLRKEARSSQILERVREVLKPRARLEERLRTGGEVRGRLEGIGIIPLLRTLAVERPDARFVLRDAWNLFEVDIRRGSLADLTRTAIDGSFSRGEAALPQLLGATSGRFTISEAQHPVRSVFDEPLEDSLRRGTRWLGALMDAVSGTGLMHAASLTFNDEVMSALMRTSPEPVRQLVQKLAQGQGPRELILAGDVAPQSLESVLVDLARRGALRSVQGPSGEDRVAMSLKERESSSPRDLDHAMNGRDSLAGIESPEEDLMVQPGWLLESVSPEERAAMSSSNLRSPFEDDMDKDLRHLAEHTQRHISSYPPPAARSKMGGVLSQVSAEVMSTAVPARERVSAHTIPEVDFPSEFVSSFDSSLIGITEPPPASEASPRQARPEAVEGAAVNHHRASPIATHAERPSARRKERAAASWLWSMSLVLLVCIGFLGWRVWQMETSQPASVMPMAREATASPQASATGSSAPVPDENSAVASPLPGTVSDDPANQFQVGVRQAGIHSEQGLALKPLQGLLVLNAPEGGAAPRLRLDGQPVRFESGRIRKEFALASGQHELAIVSDNETSYRLFAIHEGETRVVDIESLVLLADRGASAPQP